MLANPIIKKYPNASVKRFGGSVFHCIDAHTCGNPVRLVADGGPALEGNTMSERRQHFLKEYDWIRNGLMFEPRGHDMMSGKNIAIRLFAYVLPETKKLFNSKLN